ncbi:MAG: TolC family protein [Desulfobia sp.]
MHIHRQTLIIPLFLLGLVLWAAPAYAGSPVKALTLEEALERALTANPELTAFRGKITKGKARLQQAGLYPNPDLAFELEGFGGSGNFQGTGNAERTLTIEQDILLGGKIKNRRRVKAEEIEYSRREMKILEQDIRKEVKQAFIKTAGARKAVKLQQELMDLSQRVHEAVRQKADAGRVSRIEAVKAEIELKNNLQILRTLNHRLERARKNLASFWGSEKPEFGKVTADLGSLPDLPSFADLKTGLRKSPDNSRFQTRKKLEQARHDLALARSKPDLKLSGGYRQIPETDDNAFIFEIAIPLQIFDRNQGNIKAAGLATEQVADQRAAALNTLDKKLNDAYQKALSDREEIQTLQEDIIPASREVFTAKKEGYQDGEFPFLELLDAQRVLFESQQRYNEALVSYHLAIAEIERITPVKDITKRIGQE